MHRKALGRGLEALIPGAAPGAGVADAPQSGVRHIEVGEIGPNPFQPRTRFDDDALQELSASIKATGVLQPILVRHQADSFQLVAGERRLRAAQLAGLERIPAIVRDVDDREMMELALIENIQREDLNPIDEARAYKALVGGVGLTHDQLSERVGKQRSSISNSLRLLTLPV
ncbi:MAG: ParB/RepB/Spo0J family partition protein, partial [Candidatus Eisenbacteria bacterium]|nr:ParB/RepB/Spo0J family partition protein [Candidatus Eisenbacteria bacterium]